MAVCCNNNYRVRRTIIIYYCCYRCNPQTVARTFIVGTLYSNGRGYRRRQCLHAGRRLPYYY